MALVQKPITPEIQAWEALTERRQGAARALRWESELPRGTGRGFPAALSAGPKAPRELPLRSVPKRRVCRVSILGTVIMVLGRYLLFGYVDP